MAATEPGAHGVVVRGVGTGVTGSTGNHYTGEV